MKRVAAGAHLPTPSLFEPAKLTDDRGDITAYIFPLCEFLVQLMNTLNVASIDTTFSCFESPSLICRILELMEV